MRLRNRDREILALAVPALGALAAEPLYLLADTAIVGHLGVRQLAALALAGVLAALAAPVVAAPGGDGEVGRLAARHARFAGRRWALVGAAA